MKKGKRIQRMVERRTTDYQRMCAEAERMNPGSSKGYTKPGSRNLRKS